MRLLSEVRNDIDFRRSARISERHGAGARS
jgi:hypothetical protein